MFETLLVIYMWIGILLSVRWYWLAMFGEFENQDTYAGMAITASLFWIISLWLEIEIKKIKEK